MLYKYLNPHRADVIENLSIRFSQPSALNDPFEATALIELSQIVSFNFEQEFEAMVNEEGLDRNDPEYQTLKEEVVAELEEHLAKIIHPKKVGDEIMERMEYAQGVLSLSRTKESLLMWAHYGDSHKGYALGFDENHEFFEVRDMMGRPTAPKNVVYTTQRVQIDASRDDYREAILCTKSLEWAYEEEVRVFRTFGRKFSDFERNTKGQIHLFPIPPDCIREVYFGANCDTRTQKRILAAIDRHKLNVKVYVAHLLFEKYALGFTEIPSTRIFSFRMKKFYKETASNLSDIERSGYLTPDIG